jgi:hypothetical protein
MTQCRIAAVATAAGVGASAWADTVVPHVFGGLAGSIFGRNRGRLPFLEVGADSQPFTPETNQGGMVRTTIRLRVNVGGADLETAEALANAILTSAIAAIRSVVADNYTALGGDQIDSFKPGPCWHQQEASVQVEHSYSASDYEVA